MTIRRLLAFLIVGLSLCASSCSDSPSSPDDETTSAQLPDDALVTDELVAGDEGFGSAPADELESQPAETIDDAVEASEDTIPETTTEPPRPTPDIPGTLYVAVDGVDTPGGGRFSDEPLRTPAFAVSESVPGDTIEINSGVYQPLEIAQRQNLNIQSTPGAVVTFTSGSYTDGAGIRIVDSSSITVSGLSFERLLFGIQVESSEGITIRQNRLTDLGQEAISAKLESTNVQILDNNISFTGRREGHNGRYEYRTFGEGIYLGTGTTSADGSVDQVSNVVIDGNTISNTTAEAIDIKASVIDVQVSNNIIHDIDVASGGAIAIGRGTREYNANVTVENNVIYNITTWSEYNDGIGIRVSSTAQIRNNAIWGAAHRGILVDEEFRSVDATGVSILDNLIFDVGLERVEIRPSDVVTVCGTTESPDALNFDPATVTAESIGTLLEKLQVSSNC